MVKIGRNDPCPCGSGRKYKKCCKSLKALLGTKDVPPDNDKKIGKKEALLADLLGQFVDHELTKEDLLNIARDDELRTEEVRKLMAEFSQNAGVLEENLSVWDRDHGLSEPEEEEDDGYYERIESELFYYDIEKQYDKAKDQGMFEVLKILELDEKHSDNNLVLAVNYFNERGGFIEEDAPTRFLNRYEQRMVRKDGKFRPKLYAMLLSMKFAAALKEKTAFIKHSNKFSF